MPSSGPTGYKTKAAISAPKHKGRATRLLSDFRACADCSWQGTGPGGERAARRTLGTAKYLTSEVPPSLLSTLAEDSGFI